MVNILIVEDNAIIGLGIERQVKKAGFKVIANVQTYYNAKYIVSTNDNIDVILMDINLGENSKDGIALVQEIKKIDNFPIVYITGEHSFNTHIRALETRPISYISKPFNPSTLIDAINMAYSQKVY